MATDVELAEPDLSEVLSEKIDKLTGEQSKVLLQYLVGLMHSKRGAEEFLRAGLGMADIVASQ